jgi:hypothetical protein
VGGSEPERVVIVVPRKETQLHEYLRRSLASVKNVEVVLDRRATAITPADDRRRRAPHNAERKILICSLVRCPPAPAPRPVPPPPSREGERPRTLLWPGLRIEQL